MENAKLEIKEYYNENQNDALINDLIFLANAGTYVFRGYSLQDELFPKIIRKDDYSRVEFDLLDEFEKFGSHYFNANSPIDFISYGQHYGLPTRLIDFTLNPFIALSFSLFSKKSLTCYGEKDDKDYYYIRYCDISEHIYLKGLPEFYGFSFGVHKAEFLSSRCSSVLQNYSDYLSNPGKSDFQGYIKGMLSCAYGPSKENEETISRKIINEKLCFINPNQSNQRIIMQQGLFLLPYTLEKSKHLEIITKNTSVIKIHRDLRAPLLKYLDIIGHNTFRLMPDLTSICAAVTQRVIDRLEVLSE